MKYYIVLFIFGGFLSGCNHSSDSDINIPTIPESIQTYVNTETMPLDNIEYYTSDSPLIKTETMLVKYTTENGIEEELVKVRSCQGCHWKCH